MWEVTNETLTCELSLRLSGAPPTVRRGGRLLPRINRLNAAMSPGRRNRLQREKPANAAFPNKLRGEPQFFWNYGTLCAQGKGTGKRRCR